ncbi:hypothetical protein [Sandaracinus amylolyticus]|uniref:hypothetical protein n=1 Tax=Sandaracinus amylolyticus TaxID=927083 RepID=UPI001F2C3131|nr:hypothetical protein [Sandaracinus amylolyticus]UJR83921.1 Hypothetical protein I5071_59920 [Sandaracinus amylolyticus]
MRRASCQFRDTTYGYVLGDAFEVRRSTRAGGAAPYRCVEGHEAVRVIDAHAHRILPELRALLAEIAGYAGASQYDDADVKRLVRSEVGSLAGRLALARRVQPRIVIVAGPRGPSEPAAVPEPELTWLDLELLDEEGEPIADARYEVTLPSGEVRSGTLGSNGRARVDTGTERGTAHVVFPDLEAERTVERAH